MSREKTHHRGRPGWWQWNQKASWAAVIPSEARNLTYVERVTQAYVTVGAFERPLAASGIVYRAWRWQAVRLGETT